MQSAPAATTAVKESIITSIRPVGRHTVVNLTVTKNHTFITADGIPVHNCDKMSPLAQGYLRNEMETYSDTCRFLLTCNYAAKIIPAIHSRTQELRFPSLNREDFTMRLADVLISENVQFEPEVLMDYVGATHPDLRKCINLAQQNTRNSVLAPLRKDEGGTKDYLVSMIELFRQGRFLEARKLIIGQIQPEEYDDFFKSLYQNLNLFGTTQDQQDDALLIIRKYMVHHAIVADPELNISAMLIELSRITIS